MGVNLPIYRHRLAAAVREAENKLCATARHYDAVRDRYQAEIETLYAQFREHHLTLKILETDIVPRAEETLRLTMESYRAGRADFQQLMDVYRTLLRYRVDLHRHLALSEQALASARTSSGLCRHVVNGVSVRYWYRCRAVWFPSRPLARVQRSKHAVESSRPIVRRGCPGIFICRLRLRFRSVILQLDVSGSVGVPKIRPCPIHLTAHAVQFYLMGISKLTSQQD